MLSFDSKKELINLRKINRYLSLDASKLLTDAYNTLDDCILEKITNEHKRNSAGGIGHSANVTSQTMHRCNCDYNQSNFRAHNVLPKCTCSNHPSTNPYQFRRVLSSNKTYNYSNQYANEKPYNKNQTPCSCRKGNRCYCCFDSTDNEEVQANSQQQINQNHKQNGSSNHKQNDSSNHKQNDSPNHKQNSISNHKQNDSLNHKQNDSLNHKQNDSLNHKQNDSSNHKQNGGLNHKQNDSPNHKQNGGLNHKQNDSPNHKQNGGSNHKQKLKQRSGQNQQRTSKSSDVKKGQAKSCKCKNCTCDGDKYSISKSKEEAGGETCRPDCKCKIGEDDDEFILFVRNNVSKKSDSGENKRHLTEIPEYSSVSASDIEKTESEDVYRSSEGRIRQDYSQNMKSGSNMSVQSYKSRKLISQEDLDDINQFRKKFYFECHAVPKDAFERERSNQRNNADGAKSKRCCCCCKCNNNFGNELRHSFNNEQQRHMETDRKPYRLDDYGTRREHNESYQSTRLQNNTEKLCPNYTINIPEICFKFPINGGKIVIANQGDDTLISHKPSATNAANNIDGQNRRDEREQDRYSVSLRHEEGFKYP